MLGLKGMAIAAAAGLTLAGLAYLAGRHDGRALERGSQTAAQLEAVDAARNVENRSLSCVSDPACVLPDPWRVQAVPPDRGGRD